MYREFEISLMALCAWREASGEPALGIRAICFVIVNRSHKRGEPIAHVIYAPAQFNSMTCKADSRLYAVPSPDDAVFRVCLQEATLVHDRKVDDPTFGSTYYFNPKVAVPAWVLTLIPTVIIGNHSFFKELK